MSALLHIGGELSGQTLEPPDGKLSYVTGNGDSYVVMRMPDDIEVMAEAGMCFREAKTQYRAISAANASSSASAGASASSEIPQPPPEIELPDTELL